MEISAKRRMGKLIMSGSSVCVCTLDYGEPGAIRNGQKIIMKMTEVKETSLSVHVYSIMKKVE